MKFAGGVWICTTIKLHHKTALISSRLVEISSDSLPVFIWKFPPKFQYLKASTHTHKISYKTTAQYETAY